MTDKQIIKALRCWTGKTVKDEECAECSFGEDCTLGEIVDATEKRINELTAENAALRERLEKAVGGWISIEERLPETDNKNTHDFDVLVYVPKRDGCRQHGVYLGKLLHVNADDGTGNFWGIKTEACEWTVWGWSYFEHPVVTHWKPLPPLPIQAEARLAELKGGKE